MRVGMPHMGNVYIPFKAIFDRLDMDYGIPNLLFVELHIYTSLILHTKQPSIKIAALCINYL